MDLSDIVKYWKNVACLSCWGCLIVVVAGLNCFLVSPGDPFFQEGHCLFMLNLRSLLSSSNLVVLTPGFQLHHFA